MLLTSLRIELNQLSTRIEEMDALIARTSKENDACQRLTSIPGVGPVTATALVAAIGNGSVFRKGRDLAAWVGLVPREYSTRGKQKLLGISKQGNSYLRRLFCNVRAVSFVSAKGRGAVRSPADAVNKSFASERGCGRAGEQARANGVGSPFLTTNHTAARCQQRLDSDSDRNENSRQVCWRIRRWHNGRTSAF